MSRCVGTISSFVCDWQVVECAQLWFRRGVRLMQSSITARSVIQFGSESNRILQAIQSHEGYKERRDLAVRVVLFIARMCSIPTDPQYVVFVPAINNLLSCSDLSATDEEREESASASVPTRHSVPAAAEAVQLLIESLLLQRPRGGNALAVEEFIKVVGRLPERGRVRFCLNTARKSTTFLKFLFRVSISFRFAVEPATSAADEQTTSRSRPGLPRGVPTETLSAALDSTTGSFATLRSIACRAVFFEGELTASRMFTQVQTRGADVVIIEGQTVSLSGFRVAVKRVIQSVETAIAHLMLGIATPPITVTDSPSCDSSKYMASFTGQRVSSRTEPALPGLQCTNHFESCLYDVLECASQPIIFDGHPLLYATTDNNGMGRASVQIYILHSLHVHSSACVTVSYEFDFHYCQEILNG